MKPELPDGRTRFSTLYAMAGQMGWSSADVAQSSLWQLLAAHDGWRRANVPEDEDEGGMTASELEAASDLLDELEATVH